MTRVVLLCAALAGCGAPALVGGDECAELATVLHEETARCFATPASEDDTRAKCSGHVYFDVDVEACRAALRAESCADMHAGIVPDACTWIAF